MDDFEIELKQGFLEESAQLLTDTEQCFLSLESNPEDGSILERIFRLAHNLKGSSKAVGFSELGQFTHEFENLLLKLKKGELKASSEVVSILLRCNDFLKDTVDKLKADLSTVIDYSGIEKEVKDCIEGKSATGLASHQASVATEESETKQDFEEEDSIAADEIAALESAVLAMPVEELVAAAEIKEEVNAAQVAAPLVSTPTPAAAGSATSAPAALSAGASKSPVQSEESIRVSLQRLEKLINFVGEMVILQTVLREQAYGNNPSLLRKTVQQLGKVGKEIQDISMSLRMVPVKQTFQKMQRIVRDTSNLLNKKVNLVLTGEETELDKTVLEAVSDPLVHLVRNAVDHGIESNADRLKAGKVEAGTVYLSAYHQGGKLVIEVRDDGGGINHERLIQKAKEKGILAANANLSKEQGVNLIFHAGFSTKTEVTEVSGRGVGMDVVRTNIESLQGEIQLQTDIGKGTTFKIVLPLTLAIIDGMVVQLDTQRYVIPLAHVHESYRPTAQDIKKVTGMGEILLLRGENLPLYRLSQCLGWKREEKNAEDGIALVVRVGERPFAILVDDIIGQYQVVIKKLGQEVQHLKGFSGSAILGDGRPSLILELCELIRSGFSSKNPEPRGRVAA